MVIKPEDCTQGNAEFDHKVKTVEAKIDKDLRHNWYKDRGSIKIYLEAGLRYDPEWVNIKRSLETAYGKAGWRLTFDGYSDQRDGYAFWVEITAT